MDMKISRRAALAALLGGTASACQPVKPDPLSSKAPVPVTGLFQHGVASGDPLQDRVILWSRITIDTTNETNSVSVLWEVSKTPEFEALVTSGTVSTNAARDWTVKVDATGLEAGQWYYYRFIVEDIISPVGKTRTLPSGQVSQARFAVVSCANWQSGFFNVYDHITRNGEFDALLHLGDYLYEYGERGATDAMTTAGRVHEPRHEIITLSDYRARHAQYRTDLNLQAVTSEMPMIAIWDDHESTNDSSKYGAQNHQENEGDWEDRKVNDMRSYYDWMPVRDASNNRAAEFLFRSFA